ncbi:type II secretion system protein GspJ [Pelagimonas varians]|uniref:Type II secretion system protein J n=1 Tax=Pelagimonas varians TaxID=696760 RepID=A0A238L150_9RHOB|nr:type II secretion system protein GspJ [Pelagimonas varians]PYG27244.1 type II secretion system protein J (GspJ) [Pelagimonas varians]SMX48658.1 Type II secretion system protein J precursor [Pelagimonas varians]
MSKPHRDAGLTLIELVVAMSIFALVAVMGAQALTGMMRNQESLTAKADQNARLSRAVSMLRADLSAAIPMSFYPPDRQPPQSAIRFRSGVLSISVAGRQSFESERTVGSGFQRVEWRLQNGTLSRHSWSTLIPAQNSALQQGQEVLTGVRGLSLRSYVNGRGWIDGLGIAAPVTTTVGDGDSSAGAPEVYSSTLPQAIELNFDIDGLGPLTVLESF